MKPGAQKQSPQWWERLVSTSGGTLFAVGRDGRAEVTRHDQPLCRVPVGDLKEFARKESGRKDRKK